MLEVWGKIFFRNVPTTELSTSLLEQISVDAISARPH
jgi:hypothetical protein